MGLDLRIKKEYESAQTALSKGNHALAEAFLFQAEHAAKEIGISPREIVTLRKEVYKSCANVYLDQACAQIERKGSFKKFDKALNWAEIFAQKAGLPYKNKISIVRKQESAYEVLSETWRFGNRARPLGNAVIYAHVKGENPPYSYVVLTLLKKPKHKIAIAKVYNLKGDLKRMRREDWDMIEVRSEDAVPNYYLEKLGNTYAFLWRHPLNSQRF